MIEFTVDHDEMLFLHEQLTILISHQFSLQINFVSYGNILFAHPIRQINDTRF